MTVWLPSAVVTLEHLLTDAGDVPGSGPMITEDLPDPEIALWKAYPAARPVNLSGSPIRATVIARLLLGALDDLPGQTPGLRLSGARITGRLDLSYAEVRHPLILTDCDFEEAPVLTGSRTGLAARLGSHAQLDDLLILRGQGYHGYVVASLVEADESDRPL
ncbi:hypothetical protein ABZW11_24230 [Nonomuraea sp. NPDC004580]|uniref:hypothetical protein n=1 Tax=Nonomuraea sp. NPDC004580 TaxID=3154552 RepID=UPI0033A86C15